MDAPGLWALTTEGNPNEYSSEDYKRHKELLYDANVFYRDYESRSSYPRANKLKKWDKISDRFGKIFNGKGSCPMMMMRRRNIIAPY